jgi:hypothetical protein
VYLTVLVHELISISVSNIFGAFFPLLV